jgi:hypothetical protein
MDDDVEVLVGGLANAGSVVRVGEHVLRPANTHSGTIHAFLTALRDLGFDGASVPVAIEDGRERLVFMEGDVPVTPYPEWAQSDSVLASVAELMRRFHEASRGVDPSGGTWSDEMADFDPSGDVVVCHNDVCLENVVFRHGVAVGLLDFDFAAPGRPVYDLAAFARMCVPVDDQESAAKFGWRDADRPTRLRLVADSYGLDATGRRQLLEILSETIARGGEFLLRKVEDGDPNFVKAWNELGGMERFDRRRRWWSAHHQHFAAALQ